MTQAAGGKSFSLELNGAQLEADKALQILAVAGPKVSVSINTAHALTPANLNNIARQAGGKNLSMTFNGAQASSSTLKGAMQNGGVSGTFSLDAAQAYQAPVLQDLFATTSQVILFPLWNSAGNNSGRTSGVGSFVLKAGETLPVWDAKTVGGYKLVFQGDGNLVIYGAGDSVKWASYSQGQGADTAVMQGDGNFVIYANGRAVWNAGTFNNPNAYLLFQENGELSVIRQ
ncbi:MAG TPA: hypothetical protein DCP19_00580 [Pseudomonas sp.]|nr:hypothetical protein [Pseudomonas sp.]